MLLGREIKAGPNVIVTAYPVRGLDINSSYAIYNILNQQKKDGTDKALDIIKIARIKILFYDRSLW